MELLVIATILALSLGLSFTGAYAMMSTVFFVINRAMVRSTQEQ